MSKRLPYFQFEPAEYLAGDIMFCSYGAQGLFTILTSLYWQKDCSLSVDQAIKRLKDESLLNELISEKIIKIQDGFIRISFLDDQFKKAMNTSSNNSKNGKAGAYKRWGKNSESIATPLNQDSESIALREDNNKIKEKEIKEDEIKKENFADAKNISFSEDLKFNSMQWIETVAMQHRITPEVIPKKIDEFIIFLRTKQKIHNSKKEFIDHFTNWISKNLKDAAPKTTNRNR